MKKLGLEVFSLAFGMYGIMVLLAMTVFIVEVIIGGQKRKVQEESLEDENALRSFKDRKKISQVNRRKKNYIQHDLEELFNGSYVVPGEVPESPKTPSLKMEPDDPEPEKPNKSNKPDKSDKPEPYEYFEYFDPEIYYELDIEGLFNGK